MGITSSITSEVLKFFPNTQRKGSDGSEYVGSIGGMVVFPDKKLEAVIGQYNLVSNFSLNVCCLRKQNVAIAYLPQDFNHGCLEGLIASPVKDPISLAAGALVDLPNFSSSLERFDFSHPIAVLEYIESLFRERKFRWIRFFYSINELNSFGEKVLIELQNCLQENWEFVETIDKVVKMNTGEVFSKRRTDIALAADFVAEISQPEVKTIVLFSGDADFYPSCQAWLGQDRYQKLFDPQRGIVIVSSQGVVSVELREIVNDPRCWMISLDNVVNDIPGFQIPLLF